MVLHLSVRNGQVLSWIGGWEISRVSRTSSWDWATALFKPPPTTGELADSHYGGKGQLLPNLILTCAMLASRDQQSNTYTPSFTDLKPESMVMVSIYCLFGKFRK